jgi:hypothetical protein
MRRNEKTVTYGPTSTVHEACSLTARLDRLDHHGVNHAGAVVGQNLMLHCALSKVKRSEAFRTAFVLQKRRLCHGAPAATNRWL